MTGLPHERTEPDLKHEVTVPKVGDMAHHFGGLDPRPVSKVSKDGERVCLQIGSTSTGWVPASNYTFTRRP